MTCGILNECRTLVVGFLSCLQGLNSDIGRGCRGSVGFQPALKSSQVSHISCGRAETRPPVRPRERQHATVLLVGLLASRLRRHDAKRRERHGRALVSWRGPPALARTASGEQSLCQCGSNPLNSPLNQESTLNTVACVWRSGTCVTLRDRSPAAQAVGARANCCRQEERQ